MTNKSLKRCWVGAKSKKMYLELFFLCRIFSWRFFYCSDESRVVILKVYGAFV
jgi:hypothetical protein